ncbi:hypothetical protein BKA64DRAFT_713325 [Cadophora sp. MPI-SDFR-AT-0126]|nr:hypothetical protein BKA64DRAFT_713325 [Leotiomycetes sp. MPI-SDFR-AT-0126]
MVAASMEMQHPLPKSNPGSSTQTHPTENKKVAVIGSGLAGATTAYYLHNFIREHQNVDITIFERESQIGGRIKSVKYRGLTIEVGAPSASTNDAFFLKAMKDVGLSPKRLDARWMMQRMETVGVWNGPALINYEPHEPQCTTWWELLLAVWKDGEQPWALRKLSRPSWWNLARLMWRYGLSPWTLDRSSSANRRSLNKFGPETPSWKRQPFSGLGSELRNAGLEDGVLDPADVFFRKLNLSDSFLVEVVGPLSRARFAQNIEDIRGIAAEVAYEEHYARKVSVQDGNYRLVERLIALSKASVKLYSKVKEIRKGVSKQYRLLVESLPHSTKPDVSQSWEEFDAVVIASPFCMNDIRWDGDGTDAPVARNTVSKPVTHVTHFASSRGISPTFLNLSPNMILPTHILTTANISSMPEIFSISLVGIITYIDTIYCHPRNMEDCDTVAHERIYRIESSEYLDDSILVQMVDGEAGFAFPFVHRQVWRFIAPTFDTLQQSFDEYELATHMYYTGGVDDVFPSLELSCRMGYHTADRIFVDFERDRWRSR